MNRIVFVSGLIGSGKSTFTINYALKHKEENVMIADLDYINVYFRSRSIKSELEKEGIKFIGSAFDYNHQADLPAISAEIYKPFNQGGLGIYDLAGDLNGLKIVNSMKDYIDDYKGQIDLYVVVNMFREDDIKKQIEFIENIEKTIGIKVTKIISNGHLMEHTTKEDIINNIEFCKNISKHFGVEMSLLSNTQIDTNDKIKVVELKVYPC